MLLLVLADNSRKTGGIFFAGEPTLACSRNSQSV